MITFDRILNLIEVDKYVDKFPSNYNNFFIIGSKFLRRKTERVN